MDNKRVDEGAEGDEGCFEEEGGDNDAGGYHVALGLVSVVGFLYFLCDGDEIGMEIEGREHTRRIFGQNRTAKSRNKRL